MTEKWYVEIAYSGKYLVEVEAENEIEAEDKALEMLGKACKTSYEVTDIEAW